MLDRTSPQPLHIQFEAIVRDKIKSGEWAVDSAIPSENELTGLYGISRMTVRQVLNRVVADGLLYRVQGKGTYVAEPKILSRPLSQMGIRQQLEHMGYETTTTLLDLQVSPCPFSIAESLMIPEGTPVYMIHRLRHVKGVPFSLHTSYIPETLCPQLERQDLTGQQLCDILEQQYQLEIVRRLETLEMVNATQQQAQLLEIKKNYPLLLFENLVYSHRDKPIECSQVLFRADRIKLRMEYSKQ